MQRSGERRRRNHGSMSSRLEEGQLLIPANFVLHSRAPVEIEQVRAAAEQYMLAIVNNFAGTRMLIRRVAPAEIRAPPKKGHAKDRFGEYPSVWPSGQSASSYR